MAGSWKETVKDTRGWRGVRECVTGSSELNFRESGIGRSPKEQGGDLPTFRPRSYTGAGERIDLSVVRARFSNLGDCTLREHLAVY